MARGPAYVAVVGPGDAGAPDLAAAERAGELIAERGAVLVTGGLGGVMEAASRGARSAGGRTLGLLPGADRTAANAWVELAVPTGLGELRNGLVVRASDALVAVAGGFGTLSEVALALKLGKPVVGLGTWELRQDGRDMAGILAARGPDEAVESVFRALSA